MSSQGPTPEFAQAYCALMLEGLNTEVETTKKVLAAVPNDKREYRPDPNARTAGELAWHIAETDVQFLDCIADMDFSKMAPVAEADKPKTTAEIVEWYDRNMKRATARVTAMSGEQLATPVNFMGVLTCRRLRISDFLTTTASIIAGSWRRTCGRWGRSARRSTAGATMSPSRCRIRIAPRHRARTTSL